MKTLIFGAGGNLGQELVRAFKSAGHVVTGLDRKSCELRDGVLDGLRQRILASGCDVIVNAIAYNDVDGAETPPGRNDAWMTNGSFPTVMARAAKTAGATFVHYSTDYVFDGTKPEGYREDDRPNPLSVYGKSKHLGEEWVRGAGGRSYICRTSKLFGKPGRSRSAKPSFVSAMLERAKAGHPLRIIDDEVGMPTYTADLAEATVRLVAGEHAPGTYHLVNEGPGVTWYGFAEEFFGLLGIGVPREPVPASAFPRPAPRPSRAALVNTKFPPLRPRIEALAAFFRETGLL